jgi:hypothetical protein
VQAPPGQPLQPDAFQLRWFKNGHRRITILCGLAFASPVTGLLHRDQKTRRPAARMSFGPE